jgi:hypothetical protein
MVSAVGFRTNESFDLRPEGDRHGVGRPSGSRVSIRRAGLTLATVFLAALSARQAAAAPFEYPDAVASYLRFSPDFDYDAAADDFLRCERPAVWRAASADEFKLTAARADAIKAMHVAAGRAEADGTFTLVSSANFGDYDPKGQRFSFRPFSVATFYSVVAPAPCGTGFLPPKIDLFFSNPEFVDGLPMDPGVAKAFLERRKSDRSVRVTLTVKVTGMRGDGQLEGEIVKAEVVDPLQQAAGDLAVFGK